MFIVLMQRVLKFRGVFEYFLRPLLLIGTTKNPTFHVLCFNNKNSVFWDDDVINLSELLDDRLMNLDITTDVRPIVFVPVKKYPNGYSVKGRYYLKEDDTVLLKYYLFKNDERQGSMIEISGHRNDIQSILDTLLSKLDKQMNKTE